MLGVQLNRAYLWRSQGKRSRVAHRRRRESSLGGARSEDSCACDSGPYEEAGQMDVAARDRKQLQPSKSVRSHHHQPDVHGLRSRRTLMITSLRRFRCRGHPPSAVTRCWQRSCPACRTRSDWQGSYRHLVEDHEVDPDGAIGTLKERCVVSGCDALPAGGNAECERRPEGIRREIRARRERREVARQSRGMTVMGSRSGSDPPIRGHRRSCPGGNSDQGARRSRSPPHSGRASPWCSFEGASAPATRWRGAVGSCRADRARRRGRGPPTRARRSAATTERCAWCRDRCSSGSLLRRGPRIGVERRAQSAHRVMQSRVRGADRDADDLGDPFDRQVEVVAKHHHGSVIE